MDTYFVKVGEREFAIELKNPHELVLNGQTFYVDLQPIGDSALHSLLVGSHSHLLKLERDNQEYQVTFQGQRHIVQVKTAQEKEIEQYLLRHEDESGEIEIKSHMPGMIIKVEVVPGEAVEEKQGLVILEAMKMQNEIMAPRNGIVKQVHVKEGTAVQTGDLLVTLE